MLSWVRAVLAALSGMLGRSGRSVISADLGRLVLFMAEGVSFSAGCVDPFDTKLGVKGVINCTGVCLEVVASGALEVAEAAVELIDG